MSTQSTKTIKWEPKGPGNRFDLINLLPTQTQLSQAVLSREHNTILWAGPIRQGKTLGSIVAMIKLAMADYAQGVGNGVYILGAGDTKKIERNQLTYWREVCTDLGLSFTYKLSPANYFEVGGFARFHLFGGGTEAGDDRLSGLTATSAWLDDAVELRESFINEVRYRLSFDESLLLMTTNPGRRSHFFYKTMVDKPSPGTLILNSDIYENKFLGEKRRQIFINENRGGASYARKVLNQWVDDDSVCIPVLDHMISNSDMDYATAQDGAVGLDVGNAGTHAAVLAIRQPRVDGKYQPILIADSFYHMAKEGGVILEETFLQAIRDRWAVNTLVIDPSATMMITRARAMGFQVLSANNKVQPGIDAVNNALLSGDMVIHERNLQLLGDLAGYTWNPLTDKPNKVNDHGPDAMRYLTMYLRPPIQTTYLSLPPLRR